jgi:hypothetical protein
LELKTKLFILLVLFAVLGLLSVVQVEAADFSWKDDFDYASLQAMRNAGWNLANPDGTRLESSGVVLDGTDADTSIDYLNHFPDGIYNWTIEIRALWLGHGHSQPAIYVGTERHNYGFAADGWGSQYGLYRDGAKAITFGSYKEKANTWVTLRLEKQANILSMYCDGALVNVYTEQDTSPSQLKGFSTISPWRGDEKYDYCQVSSSVSSPSDAASSGFPIFYIAVGGGIAAIAVVGAVAYSLFFAGGSAAAAGALAGGTVGTTGAAFGGAGGTSAGGAIGSDVFESVMSNLFSDTVIGIMTELGYDCSSLITPEIFSQSLSQNLPGGLSEANAEITGIYEILSDDVSGRTGIDLIQDLIRVETSPESRGRAENQGSAVWDALKSPPSPQQTQTPANAPESGTAPQP